MTGSAIVTGGSGFIGSTLIRRLRADGWTVRALARSDRSAATVTAAGASPVRTDLDGLPDPVRIFNTGGWVVDTLDVEPLHGANLALIDESLEVACVRLYNQAKDPAAYRVRLDDGLPAEQGPFYRRLSEIINADDAVWTTLSSAAASLVTEREKALARIIANAGQPRPSGSPTAPAKPPAPPVPQTPSPVLARGTGATTAPPATPAIEPPPATEPAPVDDSSDIPEAPEPPPGNEGS